MDCPEFGCDMKFFTKSSLRYHVKHIHQQQQQQNKQKPVVVGKKPRGKTLKSIVLTYRVTILVGWWVDLYLGCSTILPSQWVA